MMPRLMIYSRWKHHLILTRTSTSSSPRSQSWNWCSRKPNKQLDSLNLILDLMLIRAETQPWRRSWILRVTSSQAAKFTFTSISSFSMSYLSKVDLLMHQPWTPAARAWWDPSLVPLSATPQQWSLTQMPTPTRSERSSWSPRSVNFKKRESNLTKNLSVSLSKRINVLLTKSMTSINYFRQRLLQRKTSEKRLRSTASKRPSSQKYCKYQFSFHYL